MTKDNQKSSVQAIILIVAVFYSFKQATSAAIGDPTMYNDAERLLLLQAQVNGLQTKLDQLVIKLKEETILRGHLQILNSELETKVAQLVAAENVKQVQRLDMLQANFESKIDALITHQNTAPVDENHHLITRKHNPGNNNQIKRPLNSMSATIDDQHGKADTPSLSRLPLPPTSCRQLAFIGHHLDGIYLVSNPDTNKIETVYCDFGINLSETLFGSVALKSKSVHFFVQRSAGFALNNVVIPFDIERLNEGGAMNLVTGVFTVPVNGIYHFEFFGLKEGNAAELIVLFQVNGVDISTAYVTTLPNYLASTGISASLRLKVGDQVRLYKTSGVLHDSIRPSQYTNFSGWLVEEDLAVF